MEIIIENAGPKYSDMLYQLVEQFDALLPKALTVEDTIEVGIEAWNLAIKKSVLGEDMYKKELKVLKYKNVVEKMVEYKLQHFPDYTNIIIDFSTENYILQVKSKTAEEYFGTL